MDYSKFTVEDFLSQLGSEKSSPGGGSGAALTAATGAALLEMVARINRKREIKKSGERGSRRTTERITEIKKIRQRQTSLITLDAQAFSRLSQAFKEKKQGATLEKALNHSARVPLEICALSEKALALGILEIPRTSRWLVSDLKEAAYLLETAFHAARLNVEINLKDRKDKKFTARTRRHLEALEKKTSAFKKEILRALNL